MDSKQIDKNIKLTIVIVDDSRDEHFFIKGALKDYKNILFYDCYDGVEFLHFLEQRAREPRSVAAFPDIVILDVNMPKMNGFEVFKMVDQKGLKSHTRFYVLTTSITDFEKRNCEKFNLKCYQKPFNLEKFTQLLEEMISDCPGK